MGIAGFNIYLVLITHNMLTLLIRVSLFRPFAQTSSLNPSHYFLIVLTDTSLHMNSQWYMVDIIASGVTHTG